MKDALERPSWVNEMQQAANGDITKKWLQNVRLLITKRQPSELHLIYLYPLARNTMRGSYDKKHIWFWS